MNIEDLIRVNADWLHKSSNVSFYVMVSSTSNVYGPFYRIESFYESTKSTYYIGNCKLKDILL